MPLNTDVIDLEEERERLYEEMEEVAEEQANWDGPDRHHEVLMARGNQLDGFLGALEWVQEEWDIDSVELAGLTPGEVNRVEDVVEDNPNVRERDAWVAIGTRVAPYLEHDPENIERSEYEATITNVVDTLPLSYVRWAEERISDLSHLGADEGNGYVQLVRAKHQERSTSENG